MNNRGVQFHRVRDFKRYYFNAPAGLPTLPAYLPVCIPLDTHPPIAYLPAYLRGKRGEPKRARRMEIADELANICYDTMMLNYTILYIYI